ncbi:MAG: Triosephosphate isomerase [Parcubacteria group bacterium GW2011_GWB1_43_8]|nr:MAG: Triosephosphate isomerase [Parcubacteria group bacterium GW2011_GWB1_43_8]
MSKKIIVANWKMNPASLKEAKILFASAKKAASRLSNVETVICPPFIYIAELGHSMSKLKLGAQDVSRFDFEGARTGEVSAKMLKNLGVKYVIIGHSERRRLGETNEIINKKIGISLSLGLKVIFCVGEETRDEEGKFAEIVEQQINEGLKGLSQNLMKGLIIAYEPVWAISGNAKSKADNSESAFQMAIFIRKILMDIVGNELARKTPILYGGSVGPSNAKQFLKDGQMEGLLAGNKSLDKEEFKKILIIAENINAD